jgi:hypothetical protein
MLEALDTFLPMVDQQIAKDALRHLKKQGLDIRLGAKVTGAAVEGNAVKVRYETGGAAQEIVVDALACSVPTSRFRSTSAASSKSTRSAARRSRTSGPSATSSADRCSRTRARKRASWSRS